MKRINPKDLNACPHCGGVNGYRVTENMKVVMHGSWGVIYNKLVIRHKEARKTTVCRDCEKPFDIVEK